MGREKEALRQENNRIKIAKIDEEHGIERISHLSNDGKHSVSTRDQTKKRNRKNEDKNHKSPKRNRDLITPFAVDSGPFQFDKISEASRSALEDTPRRTISVVSQISQVENDEVAEEDIHRSEPFDEQPEISESQPSPTRGFVKEMAAGSGNNI